MHAPGAEAIPGARRTQIAWGSLGTLGLEPLPVAERAAAPDFEAKARENAAVDFSMLKTEYVRNARRVIEYARVSSPGGVVPSAVLSPRFLKQFEDTLGPTVILLVPNRSTAWVFPRLATTWTDHTADFLQAYRATPWPVSLEIFELGPDGLKAIGTVADPARDDAPAAP